VFYVRTGAGDVLAAHETPAPPPQPDGSRTIAVDEPGSAGERKRLWAATLSADGVPSSLAGPWTLRWPPEEPP
jgi:hypothetical protein